MESIEITDRGASQVSRGLLWIFSNEIYKRPTTLVPGTWCTFHCRSKIVATGYANPHSLIFGRVAALGVQENISELLKKRLVEAFSRRSHVGASQAARLVYSEGDFIPGMVIDVYSDHVVVQSNTAGIDTIVPDLETLIPSAYEEVFGRKLKGFIIKADSGIRQLEHVSNFTKVVSGDETSMRTVAFEEEGTCFVADLIDGQKTGFFLDQRENRTFLTQVVKKGGKKRLLDLCSYSGGWGLRALTSGAEHVTFVDESKEALKLVEQGIELNKIDVTKTRRAASDVFRFLESDTDTYDVVVVDPPAFVKSKKNIPQALKAYEKLNRLAWRRLKPGGILITGSCSYHVSDQDFLELLIESVGKEKGWAQVIYRGSQAADHPVLLSMPETRYLKCIGLQKIEPLSN